MGQNLLENDITASIGLQKYYVEVAWRNGTIIMDEPEIINGRDLGPDPYTTLLASLASCTLSTLRMYIDRKGWEINNIEVSLNMYQENNDGLTTTIKRDISFKDNITDEQKSRLLNIAEKCPVSKILKNNININTTI